MQPVASPALDFWSWPGWTAVAALASVFAALGTVGALFVIWRQLRLSRSEFQESREAAATPVLALVGNMTEASGRDRKIELSLDVQGSGALYRGVARFNPGGAATFDRIELKPPSPRALGTVHAPHSVKMLYAWKWDTGFDPAICHFEVTFTNALHQDLIWSLPITLGNSLMHTGAPTLKRQTIGNPKQK